MRNYRYTPTDMTGRYLFSKYTKGVWTHNLHILPYDNGFYIEMNFYLGIICESIRNWLLNMEK